MSTKYILSELNKRFIRNYSTSNPNISFANSYNTSIMINLHRSVLIEFNTFSDNPDILKVSIITLTGEEWVRSSRMYSMKRFPTKRKYTRLDYILDDTLTTLNIFSEEERNTITNFIKRVR